MESRVDHLSPVLVQVAVEVPWDKVHEGLEGAYRTVQRTARVRGFRPGKVPRNVVKSMMGKSIEREVTLRLVEESLADVVKTHALEPVSAADVDEAPALTQGAPLRFTVKLEVRPKIESVDTTALAVERRVSGITDEAVDKEIEELRMQNAELRAPDPPRPAQKGDLLDLHLDLSVEGTPRPDLSADTTRNELGGGRLLPELDAGLIGATAGETREIALTFPAEFGREELRGKAAVFTVLVKEIVERVLPASDDDFARDCGYESLEALRKETREGLEQQARQQADANVREALVDLLIDKNPVPVPPSLIERQEQAMMREMYQLQQMLGRALPMGEELHAEMHQRAERRVRAGLLFGALADLQKIEVTDADVELRFQEIASQTGKHVAKVRADYQGERRGSLESQILQNKLLEYLLTQATITDVRGEPEAVTGGAPKAG